MDKEYINAYLRARYYRLKKWAFNILGNACAICGSIDQLQIDHKDPVTKDFNVTENLRCRTKADLLLEMAKCQLLCRKCHAKKTKNEGHNKGERCGSAKLCRKDVAEIKIKLQEGISLRKIAKQYGVSHVAILYIKKNKTWIP